MTYLIFSIKVWYIQYILQLLEVFNTETNNSLFLVNLKQNFLLTPQKKHIFKGLHKLFKSNSRNNLHFVDKNTSYIVV